MLKFTNSFLIVMINFDNQFLQQWASFGTANIFRYYNFYIFYIIKIIEMYGGRNDVWQFFRKKKVSRVELLSARTRMLTGWQTLRAHWTYGGRISMSHLTAMIRTIPPMKLSGLAGQKLWTMLPQLHHHRLRTVWEIDTIRGQTDWFLSVWF